MKSQRAIGKRNHCSKGIKKEMKTFLMIKMGEKRVRKKEMETWKRMKKGRMYCQRWVWRGTYQYLRKMKA